MFQGGFPGGHDLICANKKHALRKSVFLLAQELVVTGVMQRTLHIFDYCAGEFAGFYFGGAFHLAGKVIGDHFATDSFRVGFANNVGHFCPTDIFEHHDPGEE